MARKLVNDHELNAIYPQLSLWTINSLRRQGKIPFLKIPGVRRFFYSVDEIEKWLSDNMQLPGQEA